MLKLFSSNQEIETATNDSHPVVKTQVSDRHNEPPKLTKIYLHNVFDN